MEQADEKHAVADASPAADAASGPAPASAAISMLSNAASESDLSQVLPTPLDKAPTLMSYLSGRRSRRESSSTDDSDPLEPLALAQTPNLETEAEQATRLAITQTTTVTSLGSMASRLPDYEVVFEEDDPDNPRNWPTWYRWTVVSILSFTTWVVVLYSTSYTAAIPGIKEAFHIKSQPVALLGVTTYLFGLAIGAMVVAPMSELFGRRPVYIVSITIFTLLVIPGALATSLAEILVVRFFGALFGSAFVGNSPASAVDISNDENRALYMSMVALAPMNGPVLGPLIGGFLYQYKGWRWDSYIVLILAGGGILLTLLVKETYAPAILKAKTAKKRKEMDDDRYWCRYDERISALALIKLNLSRPFILAATEPILWFFNSWISIVYAILYLSFVAYPIVFTQGRGWSSGLTGLGFLGIGIGCTLAIFSEPLMRRLINNHPKDPETGRAPPEASARVMIIGAVLTPIGELVFAWTGLPKTIHWAIPIAFGIPFGFGNSITFIYGSNYMAGSYGMYAASALAGNMVIRSVAGGLLPLAGTAMYKAMTPQWAGTFLGLLEVALIPIPIVFLYYGRRIRARSRVIQQMRADAEANEAKRDKQARILARIQAKKDRMEALAAVAAADAAADAANGSSLSASTARGDHGDHGHCGVFEKDVESAAAQVQADETELRAGTGHDTPVA